MLKHSENILIYSRTFQIFYDILSGYVFGWVGGWVGAEKDSSIQKEPGNFNLDKMDLL